MNIGTRSIEVEFKRVLMINGSIFVSRIQTTHEFPMHWSVLELCDFVESEYSDLIEGGWEFSVCYL
jgi:hypothetical protein